LHGDKPIAAAPEHETETEGPTLDELKQTAEDTRQALFALNGQLDLMRSQGAKPRDLRDLEQTVAKLSRQQNEHRAALEAARRALATPPDPTAPSTQDIPDLLQQDANSARSHQQHSATLRPQLVAAANHQAQSQLQALHTRLSAYLRRARIGHIDAAMGEKRRLEREIESLAAGRYPAEHQTRHRSQSYLRDDEEYWPYEGENWPDELSQPEKAAQ
jgi:hypothetical protein